MATTSTEGAARPDTTAGLGDLLARAVVLVGRHQRPDLVERLARERRRLEMPACHVMVIGEFKQGKSSLVNALLNVWACPVHPDITTVVPLSVRYGDHVAAWVVEVPLAQGDADAPTEARRRPVPLAELATAALGAEQNRDEQLQGMEVELPRELLRQGLVIIDTPGVHGGLGAAVAAPTLRALALTDAFVFVSDAGQEYTEPELEFLQRAVEACPNVVCVLTKTDLYPQWRRIRDLDVGHLRRLGVDAPLLAVSSPVRHHALRREDAALDTESGFPALGVALRSVARAGKEVLAGRSAALAVQTTVQQVATDLATEHATLSDPARTAELVARLEEAKQRAEVLRSGASRWQQTLNDRFADAISGVDLDLAQRLRGIRKDAADAVASGDPAAMWTDLEGWIRRRTNDEMLEHFDRIRAEAESVAADVARRFEMEAETGPLAGANAPALSVVSAELASPRFEQLSLRELAFIAVRGSTTSMVISGMVGTFAAFALPILTPAAGLLAATLGRKAVRSAKDTQLRARRSDALRAIQTYLEETELAARKSSKDVLRHTNQVLRDYFSQRAEELHVSAGRNLETAARSIKEDRDQGQAHLARVAAELAEARALVAEAGRALEALTPPAGTTAP